MLVLEINFYSAEGIVGELSNLDFIKSSENEWSNYAAKGGISVIFDHKHILGRTFFIRLIQLDRKIV